MKKHILLILFLLLPIMVLAFSTVEDDDDTVQILNPLGKRNNGSMFELIYYFMPSGGKGFIGFRKK